MNRKLRAPLLLAILAALFGSGLGVAFGISEDRMKAYLAAELRENAKLSPLAPEAREKEGAALKDKAWQYFKRSHLHGGAMAALSVGLILVLNTLTGAVGLRIAAAYALGLGAVLYALFWLAAGIYAPSLGTSAAKEKFQFLAAGGLLHLAGTAAVFGLLFRKNP